MYNCLIAIVGKSFSTYQYRLLVKFNFLFKYNQIDCAVIYNVKEAGRIVKAGLKH